MSDARFGDLELHLAQQMHDLEVIIASGREKVLAEASMKGLTGSGATIRKGVSALEEGLSGHVKRMIELTQSWPGPNLSVEETRKLIVDHSRAALDKFVTSEMAYRIGSREIGVGAQNALEALVNQVRDKLSAQVREFELGANLAQDRHSASVVNIIHAQHIIGGVQQSGRDAFQTNSVNLSAELIEAALGHLIAHVETVSPELMSEIKHDVATIRSQLAKPEPSSTIVQESGRTIRTVLEGAFGGALGNAMSPGIVQALTAFSAAVGLG